MLIHCPDEIAQADLGAKLALVADAPCVVFLQGDLGAGKTTLVRGLIRALGWKGPVRSPTYTLVEPYPSGESTVYHLDLYRLGDPEELEYLGLRDMLDNSSILLVEWPDRGAGFLPKADLVLEIKHLQKGRDIDVTAGSERGKVILNRLIEESSNFAN